MSGTVPQGRVGDTTSKWIVGHITIPEPYPAVCGGDDSPGAICIEVRRPIKNFEWIPQSSIPSTANCLLPLASKPRASRPSGCSSHRIARKRLRRLSPGAVPQLTEASLVKRARFASALHITGATRFAHPPYCCVGALLYGLARLSSRSSFSRASRRTWRLDAERFTDGRNSHDCSNPQMSLADSLSMPRREVHRMLAGHTGLGC